MNLIEAQWETRNTGLKTCEIIFLRGDTIDDYNRENIEEKYSFSVVKVPVGDLGLVHQLESLGYRYLENQILLEFEIRQIEEINPKWLRLLNGFNCSLLKTQDKLDSILLEVKKNMFSSDRFSLDPIWDPELSAGRYQNWISDLFISGTTDFYVLSRQGIDVGFYSVRKDSPKTFSCPIAGIYNKFKSAGFIFVLTWFWLKNSREDGATKLTTMVSSNNRVMLSSLSKVFSFSTREIYIVLRKKV